MARQGEQPQTARSWKKPGKQGQSGLRTAYVSPAGLTGADVLQKNPSLVALMSNVNIWP
jgi:hypothetical protein